MVDFSPGELFAALEPDSGTDPGVAPGFDALAGSFPKMEDWQALLSPSAEGSVGADRFAQRVLASRSQSRDRIGAVLSNPQPQMLGAKNEGLERGLLSTLVTGTEHPDERSASLEVAKFIHAADSGLLTGELAKAGDTYRKLMADGQIGMDEVEEFGRLVGQFARATQKLADPELAPTDPSLSTAKVRPDGVAMRVEKWPSVSRDTPLASRLNDIGKRNPSFVAETGIRSVVKILTGAEDEAEPSVEASLAAVFGTPLDPAEVPNLVDLLPQVFDVAAQVSGVPVETLERRAAALNVEATVFDTDPIHKAALSGSDLRLAPLAKAPVEMGEIEQFGSRTFDDDGVYVVRHPDGSTHVESPLEYTRSTYAIDAVGPNGFVHRAKEPLPVQSVQAERQAAVSEFGDGMFESWPPGRVPPVFDEDLTIVVKAPLESNTETYPNARKAHGRFIDSLRRAGIQFRHTITDPHLGASVGFVGEDESLDWESESDVLAEEHQPVVDLVLKFDTLDDLRAAWDADDSTYGEPFLHKAAYVNDSSEAPLSAKEAYEVHMSDGAVRGVAIRATPGDKSATTKVWLPERLHSHIQAVSPNPTDKLDDSLDDNGTLGGVPVSRNGSGVSVQIPEGTDPWTVEDIRRRIVATGFDGRIDWVTE